MVSKKKSLQRLIQINLLEVYKSLLITGEEMTRQSTYILKCTATFYKKKKAMEIPTALTCMLQ